jgi:acetylornithine deacetylase
MTITDSAGDLSASTELLAQLVAIESVNPTLVLGGAGEARMAQYVAGWLAAAGLEVERHEVAPGRPNVIARRRGSGGGRTLVVNSHMDTVGAIGMERAFEPSIRDGRMMGRGACDTKAGLAAAMLAIARADGLRGDVVLAAVCDEEHSSIGSAAAARALEADAALVLEPTDLDIRYTHKGFAWLTIEVDGCAAHGSRHDLGIDAIARMGVVLAGIADLADDLLAARPHASLGTGSIHAGTIRGGQEIASYPSRCTVDVERRVLPGETGETALAEVAAVLERAAARHPDLVARHELTTFRSPLAVDPGEPIVALLADAITQVRGCRPQLGGAGGWTDAALFAQAGIPATVFGPAGGGLHAPEEWVDLDSVVQTLHVLDLLIAGFCG